MLESVRSLVAAQGQQQVDINVFLVRATVFEVLTQGADDYFIKVAPAGSLKAEYQAMMTANFAFPLITAKPIALHTENGRDFLLAQRIEHITASRIAVEAVKESSWRSFAGLVLGGCSQTNAEPTPNHRTVIESALALLVDPFLRDSIRTWLDWRGRSILQRLPHVRQHGDLAINNLGVTPTGLAVFDWEDYGRVDFPLLDFAVFLCSAHHFNVKDILSRILNESDNRFGALSDAVRHHHNLEKFEFVRLLVLALVLFRKLKAEGDYSSEIVATVTATIDDIWQCVDVVDQDARPSSST